MSVAPLLRGEAQSLPDRTIFVQYRQNTNPPEKWTNAVLTRRWRLVGGDELYDIKADPGQESDVAAAHPDVVSRLRAAHETWWDEVSPLLDQYCPISLGNDADTAGAAVGAIVGLFRGRAMEKAQKQARRYHPCQQ